MRPKASQQISLAMAESLLVTLRHAEEDITVPETTLRSCSPVLDGILRDTSPPDDGGNKVLTIDDVELEVLSLFVDILTANSFAPTNMSGLAKYRAAGFRSEYLAFNSGSLMPLIHKYDCQGLLMQLQEAVHASLRNPDAQRFYEAQPSLQVGRIPIESFFKKLGRSIAVMLRYDTEDSSQWMTDCTMNCLAVYLSKDSKKDDYAQLCRAKLDGLPRAVVADLLVHVFTKAPLVGEGGIEVQGAKSVKQSKRQRST